MFDEDFLELQKKSLLQKKKTLSDRDKKKPNIIPSKSNIKDSQKPEIENQKSDYNNSAPVEKQMTKDPISSTVSTIKKKIIRNQ